MPAHERTYTISVKRGVMKAFHFCRKLLSVTFFLLDISTLTGINSADLISTLQYLGILKYWKGSHIILKREVCHVVVSVFRNTGRQPKFISEIYFYSVILAG